MPAIAKITLADYDDLLASVDAGVSQRELARRYGCVPSLVARHVARARRSRDSRLTHDCESAATPQPYATTMREILEHAYVIQRLRLATSRAWRTRWPDSTPRSARLRIATCIFDS
jgi:transposase-like protein